jgi:S1-C subfamily serine protease
MIAAALATGALAPLGIARAADSAAPASQPAFPGLDQLNRECIALSRELQGSLLRVQVPPPRIAYGNIDDDARWNRYKGLNPDVKRALQQKREAAQQQYTLNNGAYAVPPATQPANGRNSVGNGSSQSNVRNQGEQAPQSQQQAESPKQQAAPAQNGGQSGGSYSNSPEQQKEQGGRQQGLTIIVPVSGNNTVNPENYPQQVLNNDLRNNGTVNFNNKTGPGFVANNIGLLIDEHKGYVLVPAYMDREMLAEQPVRLAIGDGEPIDAQLVGADQQTQLTVLQLLPPGAERNDRAASGPTQQPAQQQQSALQQQSAQPQQQAAQVQQSASPRNQATREVSRRPLEEVITGLGKPVRLASKPLLDGSVVIVFYPGDNAGRVMIWGGPSKEPTVIVGSDGQVAGVSRGGQFLSAAHCRVIADKIIRDGAVKRATLGVIISQVLAEDPERQRHAELGEKPAVRVDEVMKGSVAEKGGLKQGDVILTIGGESVRDIVSLAAIIATRNGPTKLSVLRDGAVKDVTVELTQSNVNAK